MILSLRKYAALKGCSEGNVRAAIKTGKINEGVVREDGKVKGIMVDVADKEWSNNFNTDRVRNSSLFESVVGKADNVVAGVEKPSVTIKETKVVTNKETKVITQDSDNTKEDSDNDSPTMSITEAKRKEAILKAKKLEIEIEEMQGRLIDAEKVKKSLYEFGSQVRERLLMVPDLVVDRVMAAKNRNEGHILLTVEITSALEALSSQKS